MPPRKQQRRLRVKAREYGEQQLEALGFPPRMEFELDDGSVVELTHPWLWSDDVETAYHAVQANADLDADDDGQPLRPARINGELAPPENVRVARAVLGAEEHQRFIAGGGKSSQIALAIEMMRTRTEKAAGDVDESDPKGKP